MVIENWYAIYFIIKVIIPGSMRTSAELAQKFCFHQTKVLSPNSKVEAFNIKRIERKPPVHLRNKH